MTFAESWQRVVQSASVKYKDGGTGSALQSVELRWVESGNDCLTDGCEQRTSWKVLQNKYDDECNGNGVRNFANLAKQPISINMQPH